MSAAHTPGPWRLGKRSDDVVADTNAGHNGDAESLEFYGGHLVAESIAPRNRALIAAAPELLEALQFAIRFFDQLTPADTERMRAAVTKATTPNPQSTAPATGPAA